MPSNSLPIYCAKNHYVLKDTETELNTVLLSLLV